MGELSVISSVRSSDRLDTDLREVIELAQAVILSTFHHEQHVGILGCQRRRENALERLHKVHPPVTGSPFVPLGVASQVKRVHRAVIGNLPPLRRARHRMKINRVFRDQPLRQCNDDVMLRHAGDHVRIDVLRLGANRNVQHLVRCALIDRLVAGAATGQNADQQAKRATSEDSICHCWEMFWVTPAKPLAKAKRRTPLPLGQAKVNAAWPARGFIRVLKLTHNMWTLRQLLESMSVPLTENQIQEALASLPGWAFADDAISKTYRLGSFTEAIGFITEMAFACERVNHHPELSNVYSTVAIRLCTHDAGAK